MTEEANTNISQKEQDEQMISAAFQKLLDTYLATNHRKKVDIITRAFNLAKKAHEGVRRRSGEPYILHPIAVAQIAVEEIGLGSTSICAALLHDVEEDTEYTNDDLKNLFGPKIANIVEGLTKISGGIFGDRASLQAETFKKLLLTMSDDIRVILIKMCDRLHNMRTLSSMQPSKQYKIAGETLYIYAPLADRLGLNKIKSELEDLSFRYEHPQEYHNIEQLLSTTQQERSDSFDNFVPPIRKIMEEMGLKYRIIQRIKTPYSIWRKMQEKHVAFEEIYDILAIRIIFTPESKAKEVNNCFNIYSELTKIYSPHPRRFRDWLSSPKANGYQALHNTFMSAQGKWIEVQIRSERMNDIAERGFAAHWKYKDKDLSHEESQFDTWLDSIKEILDDPQPDTLDLLDRIKLNLFSKEILVITPKGEFKRMPQDSTILDFAFSIHSFLGTHCFGAKVNQKLEPLNYRLKSGDQVEILTSKTQHVNPEWLNFVKTAKARSKIEVALRHQNREKMKEGEKMLNDFLTEKNAEINIANIDKLRKFHGFNSRDELYLAIGRGELKMNDDDIDAIYGNRRNKGWRKYVPFIGKKKVVPAAPVASDFMASLNKKKTLLLDEAALEHCTISTCCHPIPGDDALGYITPENKLEIHKRQCPVATKLKTRYGNNIIATKWADHYTQDFETAIHIKGVDTKGTLYAIADMLHNQKSVNLNRIDFEAHDGIFEGAIHCLVHDTEEVKQICQSLLKIESLEEVYREEK